MPRRRERAGGCGRKSLFDSNHLRNCSAQRPERGLVVILLSLTKPISRAQSIRRETID